MSSTIQTPAAPVGGIASDAASPRGLRWRRGGLHALAVRDDLTRITRASGEIVGYVDRVDAAEGHAYRARRYIARERRFVQLPTVWSPDDAIDSLRW